MKTEQRNTTISFLQHHVGGVNGRGLEAELVKNFDVTSLVNFNKFNCLIFI